MSRPTSLLINTTLYWVIRTYNTAGVLVDADSTPAVSVRKNGSSVGDSVTVTKRASTTGIYDCSYNPSGEAEGDQFALEESATISGQVYQHSFSVSVRAAERGTDNAATTVQIWSHNTRSLTTFGTLVSDIWAHASRTITGLTQAALALFATQDTGQTSAANGTVAKLSQGTSSGGEVIYSPAAVLPAIRPNEHLLRFWQGEFGFNYSFTVTGLSLAGNPRLTIAETDGNLVQQATPTVSGTSVTFIPTTDLTTSARTDLLWNLWDVTESGKRLVAYGPVHILKAKPPT